MDGYMQIIEGWIKRIEERVASLEAGHGELLDLPPIAKAKAKADAEAESDPMQPMTVTDGDRARS